MEYYNFGTSLGPLRKVDTGALYYNSTKLLEAVQPDAGMTFTQIMGQVAGRSKSADVSGLSSSLDAIFEEAASRFQVDVNLLRAIGKAESGFNPSAVSQAGAMGVMQLMPATAGSLGVSDPFDARQNIMGGASYIAGLIRQYNGDVSLALAAYNAGSGNVERYGGIPPFAETQAYVEKVMGYAGQGGGVSQTTASVQDKEAASAGEETPAGLTQYWSQMVDLMRIQMEMKFAGILSSEDEEAAARGLGI